MNPLKIHHVGFFNQKEHHIQKVQHLFLFLHISGLHSLKSDCLTTKKHTSFCFLFFPGDTFEFEYKENRKNWVVQFSYPGIQCKADQFSLLYGAEEIVLPRYLGVKANDLIRWENKFNSLNAVFKTPVPNERMLAQMYLFDLFKYYIEATNKKGLSSPAAKLKGLIDDPDNLRYSISELSQMCGYSADHLRILFKKKYDISPQDYRIRCTMVYAMKLICQSNLMVSDIAFKCGFKHLSHFSFLFKKTHGVTPNNAIKQFRYK